MGNNLDNIMVINQYILAVEHIAGNVDMEDTEEVDDVHKDQNCRVNKDMNEGGIYDKVYQIKTDKNSDLAFFFEVFYNRHPVFDL